MKAPLLLATFGSLGDLFPFTRLARGLRERGHPVRMLGSVFHEAALRATDLPYEVYGAMDESAKLLTHPDLWHQRRGIAVVLDALTRLLPELAAQVLACTPSGPGVLLCHPLLLPLADLVRGARPELAVVGLWLAPSNLRSCDHPMMLGPLPVPRWMPMAARRWLWRSADRHTLNPAGLPGLNRARAQAGLPAVEGFMPHIYGAADVSVGLFPPWFAPRREGWPAPFIEGDFVLEPVSQAPALPPDLERFLAAGKPPVVVTAGTGMHQADRLFARAQRVLASLGERGVFVTSHAAQLPSPLLPAIHATAFADFARLFPKAAAVVHHGGIGTTAEALRAGVPQLVMPHAFDQFDNAARVRALGVGVVLPASHAREGRLRRVLRRLLASAPVRARCEAWSPASLATPVLDQVESAVAQAIGVVRARRA